MSRIFKRGDTYYGDYVDRQGRRQRPSLHTGDRAVAKARLRDLELATTDSGPNTEPTQPLADALDYFTDITCAAKPQGTRSSYQQKARHLSRLLGSIMLDALTRENVERYIAERLNDDKAHPHTVHKELVVLRGTLKAAQERKLYHGSVDVVPKFKHDYQPRRTYLTPAQFMLLTEHLVPAPHPNASEDTRRASEERRAKRILYCILIAFASPRKGELEALDWSGVDLARNRIQIPKGKTVGRTIAIAPELRPWLELFGERAGWRGAVVDPWLNAIRDLGKACKRAGITRVTRNDLRRTFASWLVQARESLFVVATLLGHSSTRMVEKVYGRLDEMTLASAVAKLPAGFSPAPTACASFVPDTAARGGTDGTSGTTLAQAAITNSVENSVDSAVLLVPRDGVEPPTRGFSVPIPEGLRQPVTTERLKVIKGGRSK
jgi:integrase